MADAEHMRVVAARKSPGAVVSFGLVPLALTGSLAAILLLLSTGMMRNLPRQGAAAREPGCGCTCRLQAELRAQGYRIGRQRLRTALRHWGLRALQPRAFTPRTTDSTHGWAAVRP